jgi:hypothetical protein
MKHCVEAQAKILEEDGVMVRMQVISKQSLCRGQTLNLNLCSQLRGVFHPLQVDGAVGGTKHCGRLGKSDVVVLHLKVASTIRGCEACQEASSQSARTCVSQMRELFHPRTHLEPAGDLRTEKSHCLW